MILISNVIWTYLGPSAPYLEVTAAAAQGSFIQGQPLEIYVGLKVKRDFVLRSIDLVLTSSNRTIFEKTISNGNSYNYKIGQSPPVMFNGPIPFTAPKGNYQLIATIRDTAGLALQKLKFTFSIA